MAKARDVLITLITRDYACDDSELIDEIITLRFKKSDGKVIERRAYVLNVVDELVDVESTPVNLNFTGD